MADKPKRASEYKSEQLELVQATCLYVATKLGDMMDDLLVIGGLVPSLIVDQVDLPKGTDAHVGTMDLDVGLQLALLDEGRYRKLTERLRDAGFEMDENDDGNPTRQRWAITGSGTVTVDFLIPPSREEDWRQASQHRAGLRRDYRAGPPLRVPRSEAGHARWPHPLRREGDAARLGLRRRCVRGSQGTRVR